MQSLQGLAERNVQRPQTWRRNEVVDTLRSERLQLCAL